jgi:hypothetical protein
MSYIKVYPNIDADAQAFLTAAAITDPTISSSINKLVVDMKVAGVWSKMKAIYPMVGGTASTHKFNLKDPRDLDAAFRLQFNGGWTHSSNGALPNGTNAYADTNLNENAQLTLNSTHLSFYSRTNNIGTYGDMGNLNTTILGNPGTNLNIKWIDNKFYPRVNDNNAGVLNTGNSLGLFITNRVNSTQVRAFRNTTLHVITSNSIQKLNLNFYIGATNSNSIPQFFSNRQCAFASIGDGLTDTDATNLYNLTQAFQTSLGRQV